MDVTQRANNKHYNSASVTCIGNSLAQRNIRVELAGVTVLEKGIEWHSYFDKRAHFIITSGFHPLGRA